jgi:hypothetical protein
MIVPPSEKTMMGADPQLGVFYSNNYVNDRSPVIIY